MNNLLSYCGLLDARIRASDKNLPVPTYVNSLEVQLVTKSFPIIPDPSDLTVAVDPCDAQVTLVTE